MSGSHFKGPVRNKEKNGDRAWYSKLPIGEDPAYIVYYNDFISEQDYDSGDWTINETVGGTGSATEALAADERGGALKITTGDSDDDNNILEHVHEVYKLDGKRLWFEARLKVDDATESDIFMGLAVNTGGTLLTQNDRAGFQKDDGDASILAKSEKDGTETSNDSGKDMSDATYVKLGMRHDSGKIEYYVDDSLVATHSTNIPDDEQVAIAFMLQNGDGNARSMTIDYIFCAQER